MIELRLIAILAQRRATIKRLDGANTDERSNTPRFARGSVLLVLVQCRSHDFDSLNLEVQIFCVWFNLAVLICHRYDQYSTLSGHVNTFLVCEPKNFENSLEDPPKSLKCKGFHRQQFREVFSMECAVS